MASGIGSKSRERLSKVLAKSKGVISSEDVTAALKVTQQEAGRMLARWCKAGWLRRVHHGFYVELPLTATSSSYAVEDLWPVIVNIYGHGYFGGFSAVKYWDLSEQIFESQVYFCLRKVSKTAQSLAGIKLKLVSTNERNLFGLKTVWSGRTKILVSDPARTIIDLLDNPKLGGGITPVFDVLQSYLGSEFRNFDLLFSYAQNMNNKTIFKRLGALLEKAGESDSEFIAKIRSHISKGYSKIDPALNCPKIIKKWNLMIPSDW